MADEPAAASGAESISVYARIRHCEGDSEIATVPSSPEKIRARNLEFSLDCAFGTQASQAALYDVVAKGLVHSVVEGYNACILAYGQTGSGKTYTMLGPEGSKLDGTDGEVGVVPRACMQLFSGLPAGCQVAISYVEVYNDSVNDLLSSDKSKYLPLRDVGGHVEPEGLTKEPVKNANGVMAAVARGDTKRVVAAMAMNPRSSRGHGLIQIHVTKENGSPHGRLTLVDLAGMESSKKSPPEGASNVAARRQEAKAINISLLALSSVVSALASKGAMRIPFRDSKLTRLLQSSLAGNCKAAFVVTLRSEQRNTEEAIGTLRFAQRAKSVQATVLKNEDVVKPGAAGGAKTKKLAAELDLAKGMLADFEDKLASAESYKVSLMAEVQTLLSEMETLKKDSEAAKKRTSITSTGESKGAGYVQMLERRVAALEEENRVLRQRDIMHRMIQLENADGAQAEGPTAAASKPAAPVASTIDTGAKPALTFQFSAAKLATFEPFALGGFNMAVQRDAAETEQRGSPSKLERDASIRPAASSSKDSRSSTSNRSWSKLLAVSLLMGGMRKRRVHPAPDSPAASPKKAAPYQISAPKPRPKLSALDQSAKAATAAARIQAVWRGRMTRDELYWEMMGY